jgi:uroporphyrinogen-III decarboxylase
VHPGKPKVTDINHWEDYVAIPDLDELDWDGCAKKNAEYLDTNKLNQLAILSGYWERLISLMDVENAAVAMIDDDQKEGVNRLFSRLCDLFIDYISRMKSACNIDCVLLHDDWGHQNSTFFSLDTCREMLVPHYIKMIGAIHDMGLFFELHSCGKNQTLVPAMIEAGVDMWCPQPMNDFDFLTKTYPDSCIVFGVPAPALAPESSAEIVKAAAKEWVDKYKNSRVVQNFMASAPGLVDAIYEYSRIAYQNE